MVEITKQDWLKAKEQNEGLLVNALVNIEHYKSAIEMIDKKIAEFPIREENKIKQELKQELKEVLEEK